MQTLFKMILRYSTKRTINYFAVVIIFLSVTCLFTVNAVMRGFEDELSNLIRASRADMNLQWLGVTPELMDIEARMPKDVAWSPSLKSFGMIKTARFTGMVNVKGIDPEREQNLRKRMKMKALPFEKLERKVASQKSFNKMLRMFGSMSTLDHATPILVGSVLAKDLEIEIGDNVELMVLDWRGGISRSLFKVEDTFKSGWYEEDRGGVFIPIDKAANLFKHPDKLSQIQIALDGTPFVTMKSKLQGLWSNAIVRAWHENEPVGLRAMKHQRIIVVMVLSLIVIVSSCGIFSIQWNFVREKVADIGILRAVGFSARDVFGVFLGVSWVVGFSGLLLGFLGGFALSHNANDILAALGWNLFPGDIYYNEGLPVKFTLFDCLWMGAMSIIATTLAGLLPAWQAVRVEPAASIRQL